MTRFVRPLTFIFAACLLSALTLLALRPAKAPHDGAQEERQPAVDVVRAKKAPLDRTIHLPGDLLPFEFVEIYAKVPGFIETLSADRGTRVTENAVLTTLVAPELDNNIAAARATFANAEEQYLRNKNLVGGGVSVQTVETMRHAAETARENVNALLEQKNYLTVRAPFDGVITRRNLHRGAFVIAGGNYGAVSIFRLEKIKTLRLVVAAPEADVEEVNEGKEISFSVPAFPGRTFTAKVSRMSHSLDLQTRTEPFELDVDNPDETLLPGMYADVNWPIAGHAGALIVPTKAVATTTERTFVIRMTSEGLAEWVDVKRGEAAKGMVEVFGPLHEGDLIVARATDELKAGTKVRVQSVAALTPSR